MVVGLQRGVMQRTQRTELKRQRRMCKEAREKSAEESSNAEVIIEQLDQKLKESGEWYHSDNPAIKEKQTARILSTPEWQTLAWEPGARKRHHRSERLRLWQAKSDTAPLDQNSSTKNWGWMWSAPLRPTTSYTQNRHRQSQGDDQTPRRHVPEDGSVAGTVGPSSRESHAAKDAALGSTNCRNA